MLFPSPRDQTMRIEPVKQGSLRGFLHLPTEGVPSDAGLVLTHGAGANCESELLRALAAAFATAGTTVLRCDLPFRQNRSAGPPRPGDAESDQAGLRDAAAYLRGTVEGKVYLGGHSYGGRQGTMLLASEPLTADGLLLLSYPLHPPDKPNQLRTAHWPSFSRPALFIHGTKDPLGGPEEMREAMRAIPSPAQLVVIEGAGHDLKRGRFDLISSVLAPFAALVRSA
jgi:predicted alpha/beta-hydrolase family hydrolase